MAIIPLKDVRKPDGLKITMRANNRGEILIYGPIGFKDWDGEGIKAAEFAKELKKLSSATEIDVRIQSEGGGVFEAAAMYTLLVQHKAKIIVHIDGLAASAASYIAMAGDEIRISEGGFVMIHNAWGVEIGNAEDMRKMADKLETVSGTIRDVYAARTGKTKDQCAKWMREETWFTGPEAVANGFADTMVENLKVAASVSHNRFRHMPASLKPRRAEARALAAYLRSA